MAEDLERRMMAIEADNAILKADTAVLKAIMPRIEQKIDEHVASSRDASHEMAKKIDDLKEGQDEIKASVAARENQAKGAVWLANSLIVGLGTLGGIVGYFIAKVFPVLARLG